MHICMLIDIDGLLSENSRHTYLVEWEVVGALHPLVFDKIYVYDEESGMYNPYTTMT